MKHLLLALLDGGPAYGLELKEQHDALLGPISGPVNVGQIYTALGRMETQDLVNHHTEPSDVGPDRKVYALTETGTKELQRWLESPSGPPDMRSEAVSKIVLALRRGDDVRPLVADHRQLCLESLKALDFALGTAPPAANDTDQPSGDRLALDALVQAGALRIQAELRWLDHIEAQTSTGPRP